MAIDFKARSDALHSPLIREAYRTGRPYGQRSYYGQLLLQEGGDDARDVRSAMLIRELERAIRRATTLEVVRGLKDPTMLNASLGAGHTLGVALHCLIKVLGRKEAANALHQLSLGVSGRFDTTMDLALDAACGLLRR